MNTTQLFTNPYAAEHVVPLMNIQLLLLASIVCFVLGLLLAEQSVLRRILAAIDSAFSPNLAATSGAVLSRAGESI